MDKTVYRVSHARVTILALFYGVLALGLASPWMAQLVREAAFRGQWPSIAGPQLYVTLGYLAALLCGVHAVVIARLLIFDEAVILDVEGITVRHLVGTERGYWEEFREAGKAAFGPLRAAWLSFDGPRSARKVMLPSPLLGVPLQTLGAEIQRQRSNVAVQREARARLERKLAIEPPPMRPVEPSIHAEMPVFGRRPAAE